MLDTEKIQSISLEVIKVLKKRFDNFPGEIGITRNAPFHKAFLGAFSGVLDDSGTDVDQLLTMSSGIHRLNTILGQSFFENVANILCDGEKRTFKNKKIYEKQSIIKTGKT